MRGKLVPRFLCLLAEDKYLLMERKTETTSFAYAKCLPHSRPSTKMHWVNEWMLETSMEKQEDFCLYVSGIEKIVLDYIYRPGSHYYTGILWNRVWPQSSDSCTMDK